MSELSRERYALLYGPTAGDRIRLADTSLLIEVEQDLCAGGDEAVFGGGKTIRESMLQGVTSVFEGAPDLVITNVLVLDYWGVVKADVGVRDGRVVALEESPTAPKAERVAIRRNVEATIQILNDLGVVVDEWTGANGALLR